MLRRRRVMAAKTEVTVGTAIALSGTDAAMNVENLKLLPTIPMDDREGQAGFSPLSATGGPRMGTATFTTKLKGGASIPLWAATLLPAVGFVETSTVFSPVSQPPGSGGVKTITLGAYVDGVFKSICGAMGNAVFNFVAGRVVTIDWTFMGVWVPPTDVAILAPSYPSETPLRFASSGLTVGSYAYKPATMSIDLGNQVVMREDSATASGYISALITGRKITGKFDPESVLVATKDNYGIWLANTEQALAMTLGSTGNAVAFAAPKLQFTNIQESDRNGIQTDSIDFQLNRSASGGDDDLTITIT